MKRPRDGTPDPDAAGQLSLLVVDDERAVVEGLRRALMLERPEWDVVVADSGAAALAAIRERRFDAVITDMRMPGVSGADVLKEVREAQPDCIRVVLTGYADQAMLNRCLGVAHQCLSKPCHADAIGRVVEAARQREARGAVPLVRKMVGSLERLPSMPSIYAEMLQALRNPEVEVDEIGRLVARDAGLSSKLLQLVNSAFFGLSRPIANPGEAVSYLGMETIRSLVLSVGVFSTYTATEVPGLDLAREWWHALTTAELARRIVRAEGGTARMADEAYVGGLLHDAGRMVLAFNCRAAFEEINRRLESGEFGCATAAEEAVLGCNHADIAGYLFGLWGLPPAVVEAISMHHHPGCSSLTGFSVVTAVHAADALEREQDPRPGASRHGQLDLAHLEALGLASRIEAWREIARGLHQTDNPPK